MMRELIVMLAIGLTLTALFCFVAGSVLGLDYNTTEKEPTITEVSKWRFVIPTPTELQVFLHVNPDGTIGRETMKAWQLYIDTERAAYWFDPNNY